MNAVNYFQLFCTIAILFSPHYETANMKTCHMLNLGDSYTIGESVTADENFPNQLTSHLKKSGIEISVPEIIAVTGWTTNELIIHSN